MNDTTILVLNEPANGLDPKGIRDLREFLRYLCDQKGFSIFLSTHILPKIQKIADVVGIIKDGCVFKDIDLENRCGNDFYSCILKTTDNKLSIKILDKSRFKVEEMVSGL